MKATNKQHNLAKTLLVLKLIFVETSQHAVIFVLQKIPLLSK